MSRLQRSLVACCAVVLALCGCGGADPGAGPMTDGGLLFDGGGPGLDGGAVADGGSGVTTSNLVVRSNGVKIGYLLDATPIILWVWDDTRSLQFGVNDSTGFVVGHTGIAFSGAGCTGSRFWALDSFACDAPGGWPGGVTPARRYIHGADNDPNGWRRPTALMTETGSTQNLVWASSMSSRGECGNEVARSVCGLAITSTTEIPPAFTLPIVAGPP